MVSTGGQVRPFVGNPGIQEISGVLTPYIGTTIITADSSGAYVGGIGGVVSGQLLTNADGFLEFNYSGAKIWMPYWVSA